MKTNAAASLIGNFVLFTDNIGTNLIAKVTRVRRKVWWGWQFYYDDGYHIGRWVNVSYIRQIATTKNGLKEDET